MTEESTVDKEATLELLKAAVEENANSMDECALICLMIGLCISAGIKRGGEITTTIASLGFKKQRVGQWLSTFADANSDDALWYRSDERLYELHERQGTEPKILSLG